MCLRNHDKIETTFASINDIELDEDTVRVLFEPRFLIRPDESHLEKHRPDADDTLKRRYAEIEELKAKPKSVSVLFGSTSSPYIRVDPFFMHRLPDDPEAEAALGSLMEAIDNQLKSTALNPGDVLFVDNFRVVHGRNPFTARYDGTDRWLKRVNIARDLRKSRAARRDAESRTIL
jgi:hypothetical protein